MKHYMKEQAFSEKNFQDILQQSFKLPSELENVDIWSSINKKLNQRFHKEFFSENSLLGWSDKIKFYIGLFEYLDGETSSQKTQIINNHLSECASCREAYLTFTKLRQYINFSFNSMQNSNQCLNQDTDSFWHELEIKLENLNLLPCNDNKENYRKIQGL